jgi:hypothetical protein
MPVENQRQADRSTSLEAITLKATLNLAHAGRHNSSSPKLRKRSIGSRSRAENCSQLQPLVDPQLMQR